MDPVIEAKNLTKIYNIPQKRQGFLGSFRSIFNRQYKKVKAVDNVSFKINEGELVGFIGPNGAGKTTTLKILSGLIYPTDGETTVLGFTPSKRQAEFQKQFALVAGQKNQLWWDLPATETFLLTKAIYEVTDSDYKKRVTDLSEMLEISGLLATPVKKLSLGQRMKAELVTALIHQPKVLFLDEPTIGLDVVAQKKMRDFIRDYNLKYKSTIILTSHYMEDVEELCERVIIINKGTIIYDGPLAEIVTKFVKIKTLILDFNKPVTSQKLREYGKVVKSTPTGATIEIERDKIAAITAKVLQEFPVSDLIVQEPSVEDVIRNIFTKNA